MILSEKALSVSPSPTLAIDAKYKAMKAEGVDVVGFGAGEPDFDTPEHIKNAAIAAINNGFTKYTPASGTMELKKAICEKFKNDNNIDYKPENIVVSNGAKHSLVNAFKAILNPGDEVIIPAPYWVSYPEMVRLNDGVPVILETTEEQGFKFTADQLKSVITDKTKAVILNDPSNPTGMVYTKEELEEIAKVIVEKDIFVISDEIYEKLIYDGAAHTSIASLGEEIKEHTIVINGVSKSYSMTGWRIGFCGAPAKIAKAMSNVQSHEASNPCSISQAATLAALTGPQNALKAMKAEFSARREYMVERINDVHGISCLKPLGAFYVMMNIKGVLGKEICGKVINNSDEFCEWLLEKNKVALVPGSGFGAEGYVRWSYATSLENIEKGIERIIEFLSDIK